MECRTPLGILPEPTPFGSVEIDMFAYSLHRVKAYFGVNIAVTDVGLECLFRSLPFKVSRQSKMKPSDHLGK